MNKFEKTIIVVTLVVGLVGGIILIALKFPPIIPSILISTAISVLVYHFLGGIKDAGFNMGPVKMGGSIAALIGCAFVINHYLEPQMPHNSGELTLTSDFEVVDSEKNILGHLYLDKYSLELNDKKQVVLNNSIVLGALEDSLIKELNRYDRLFFRDYTEVYYTLQMSPFKADLDITKDTETKQDFLNAYMDLPFTVKPTFHEGSDKTMVTHKANSEKSYHTMKKGKTMVVDDFLKSDSKVYLVRIRQLDRVDPDCFVQYQIITLSYRKK